MKIMKRVNTYSYCFRLNFNLQPRLKIYLYEQVAAVVASISVAVDVVDVTVAAVVTIAMRNT